MCRLQSLVRWSPHIFYCLLDTRASPCTRCPLPKLNHQLVLSMAVTVVKADLPSTPSAIGSCLKKFTWNLRVVRRTANHQQTCSKKEGAVPAFPRDPSSPSSWARAGSAQSTKRWSIHFERDSQHLVMSSQ